MSDVLCADAVYPEDSASWAADDLFSQLSSFELELLEECSMKLVHLKNRYRTVSIQAEEVRYRYKKVKSIDNTFPSPSDGVLIQVPGINYRFYALDGEFGRLEGDVLDNASGERIERQVGIIRPDGSYLLKLDPGSGDYFVVAHQKNRPRDWEAIANHPFQQVAFSLGGNEVRRALFTRSVGATIDSVEINTDTGRSEDELIVIRRSYVDPDSGHSSIQTFSLYRNRSCAVKLARIDDKMPSTAVGVAAGGPWVAVIEQKCEYGAMDGEFPLLDEYVLKTSSGVDDESVVLKKEKRAKVVSINFEKPPLELFSVCEFISDFQRIGDRKEPASTRWWLFAINITILVVIFLVYGMSRKHRKKGGVSGNGEKGV